ncbi:hypothetical protein CRM22_005503 [Opisthorchis felineus]|nr:hypothetical protein CRM22_005503 [Opisthorchis felineus]
MAGFFECHRGQTFEAVHRGKGPVPFSVKFSVKGEKVNLYLRLGLAMFGVMSIAHVAVKFAEDTREKRNDFLLYLKSILEMAFFALQTLFILRYHRLVILRHNEVMGAGLVHLLTTNLCMWADISVGKIDKTLSVGGHKIGSLALVESNGATNLVNPYNHSQYAKSHLDEEGFFGVSFYLLPTVSEYCLLAAALLYEITVRIGQPSFIEIEKVKDGKSHKNKFHECRGCITSAGSWFSILTVTVVVALTIGTLATPKPPYTQQNYWKSITILAEEATLCAFGLGFVVTAIYQTRKLKFSIATRQSHVEEFLLYTAFFFSSNYTISTIILAMDLKERGESLHRTESFLILVRCILKALELLQIVVQTYMIQDCFHRCSDKLTHQIIKPGRQSIVALLGINLALWIQQSFQLKNADIIFLLPNEKDSYGWILFVVTMPISLFYRYHCTVCLSQCFNKLYEDETQRFEEIWRYRVDPLTDMVIPAVDTFCMYDHTETNGRSSRDHKSSDDSITSARTKRMGIFLKHKPWKTVDIPDEQHSPTHVEILMVQDGEHEPCNHEIPNLQTVSSKLDSNHSPEEKYLTDEINVPVMQLNDSSYAVTDDIEQTNIQNNQWTISSLHNNLCVPEEVLRKRASNVNLDTSDKGGDSKRQTEIGFNGKATLPRRKRLSLPMVSSKGTFNSLPVQAKDDRSSKPTNWLKSPRHSLSKHTTGAQPIRRRRTLRNLETAKYRVLAAELAHRMVIERGTSACTPEGQVHGTGVTVPSDSILPSMSGDFNYSTIAAAQNVNKPLLNSKHLFTLNDKPEYKTDFRLVQAMNETAAITIAPVESRVLSNLSTPKLLISEEDTSEQITCRQRIRRSLFLSPISARKFPPKPEGFLSPTSDQADQQPMHKSGSWSFSRSIGGSGLRNILQSTDKKPTESRREFKGLEVKPSNRRLSERDIPDDE